MWVEKEIEMIEVGSTFWIMLVIMWITVPMALFLGVAWGRTKERSDWNDLIKQGKIPAPLNEPPEPW